jgi:hypothetical protein
MITKIIKGKDISFEKTIEIKQIRANAFSDWIIKKERRIPFTDEILFITKDNNNKILAIGCLYQIKIKFLWKLYAIQWIGSIVSIEKGKWYGKKLMQKIYNYLKKNKATGLGFCSPINTIFYQKCNFLIQKNIIHRFIKRTNTWRQPDNDEDILYIDGENALIQKILSHPKANIYIQNFW